MYVRTYVCLLFVNGLIRVMPKAIRTYVRHDRKPVCIALERRRREDEGHRRGGVRGEEGSIGCSDEEGI
jgi:hypothetical protein